jgi:hypothetical protein
MLTSLRNLLTRIPKKKEHVPKLESEKEILRLKILGQALQRKNHFK